MLLDEALILYHDLRNRLKKYSGMRVYCVGSSARHEKEINNIDLITPDPLFGDPDKKYIQIKHGDTNIDIWRINDIKFAKFMHSFNKQDSIVLRAVAKKRGYKLNDKGLYFGNKRIDVKNKRDLLRILGIHHIK